ncbi:HNH endonuclease [Pseudomonas ogarae]
MSKYAPLANHLKAQLEDSVELAFTHIDSLVNGLPPSARNHDAWWANSRTEDSHTWAHLWIAAGWECDSVDRANEIAVFRRASDSLSKPAHRYWWVNHKQTHLDEYSGGYIWAPKTKKNGNSNEGYLNLTKAKVGDRIISYANGVIKSIGVVTHGYVDAPIPKTHWEAAEYWGSSGWQVSVEWMPLTTPLRPKHFLDQIAPLLPEKYSPIQKNGDGNQGIYLASISQDLGNLILRLVCEVDPTAVQTVNEIEIEGEDALQEQILRSSEIPETEKQQLVRSRIGQGIFRMRVAQQEKRCRLTGVDNLAFLVASHIKPWRDSDNEERLCGSNGLLLSPHVDKLFDRGWISFSDDGRVLISAQAKSVAQAWGLVGTSNVGAFDPVQRTFLKYHREKIFKGS